ncbi:ABC transporter ATP-binding protein [Mycoplasmopsis agassizii]|uniref:ABC transporter ATP-binding protein n=1 Tax=Mycoplasmopsis agassizii TaxID=33922 RepID=A0ABX4H5K4_9BACT|nr:ABC transporter ATP-binding protein [Mycoplasmopsis agassizii]PAF55063.1 ABC transporter ATP-binding protein [Mycoplasmopsis agassizii]SMC19046.1 ATP-binding cassette, subfamily B [Mycoplasmopsis agassizii]
MTSKNIKADAKRFKKNRKSFSKAGIKFIWRYFREFKKLSILIIFFALATVLGNAALIIGLFFLSSEITRVINEAIIANSGYNSDFGTYLIYMLVVFTFGYIAVAIINLTRNILAGTFSSKIGKKMREDVFMKLKVIRVLYYDQTASGDLISRVANDTDNVTNFIADNAVGIVNDMAQLVIMAIAMFIFSPIISAITILGFLPIIFVIVYFILKISRKSFVARQQSIGKLNAFFEEAFSSLKSIKAVNATQKIYQDFSENNNRQIKVDRKAEIIGYYVFSWNLFINDLLNLIILVIPVVFMINNREWGGVISTTTNGVTNPESFAVLATYNLFYRNYAGPQFQIFNNLNNFQNAVAGADRVNEVHIQESEHNEKETVDLIDIKGDVSIRNLNFSYLPDKPILKNVSFDVKRGQSVGIVGPTGSGKTTIINLLTKFYDVENGNILIDNIPIQNITKKSMRNNVSIVLQDTFLFNETIMENIRYARPEASDEEVIEAAKIANAHNMIMKLEKGYQTPLDENVMNLSQGEKQLLAIARAVLKDSSILILDEATSSIDTETEAIIQKAMLKLQEGKTTFIIAHRLSTIKHADLIIVLKNGEILEKGNHEQLLAEKGFYYSMYYSNQRDMDSFE